MGFLLTYLHFHLQTLLESLGCSRTTTHCTRCITHPHNLFNLLISYSLCLFDCKNRILIGLGGCLRGDFVLSFSRLGMRSVLLPLYNQKLVQMPSLLGSYMLHDVSLKYYCLHAEVPCSCGASFLLQFLGKDDRSKGR